MTGLTDKFKPISQNADGDDDLKSFLESSIDLFKNHVLATINAS